LNSRWTVIYDGASRKVRFASLVLVIVELILYRNQSIVGLFVTFDSHTTGRDAEYKVMEGSVFEVKKAGLVWLTSRPMWANDGVRAGWMEFTALIGASSFYRANSFTDPPFLSLVQKERRHFSMSSVKRWSSPIPALVTAKPFLF
jgi:hypothetical protein